LSLEDYTYGFRDEGMQETDLVGRGRVKQQTSKLTLSGLGRSRDRVASNNVLIELQACCSGIRRSHYLGNIYGDKHQYLMA
jgi:hypothetical protein